MELERRHLAHLAAVAEHRNVTRAAEALGLTQPALSRSIQEIERILGLRCFDRLPQGSVPTAACLTLVERARAMLKDFEAFEGARSASASTSRVRWPSASALPSRGEARDALRLDVAAGAALAAGGYAEPAGL